MAVSGVRNRVRIAVTWKVRRNVARVVAFTRDNWLSPDSQ